VCGALIDRVGVWYEAAGEWSHVDGVLDLVHCAERVVEAAKGAEWIVRRSCMQCLYSGMQKLVYDAQEPVDNAQRMSYGA